MKAVDGNRLLTILDEDLTWRRKEISTIAALARLGSSLERRSLIRAGLPLLYAHWEGFTRTCFIRYFEMVSLKRKPFSSLGRNFLYLASKSEIKAIVLGNEEAALAAFDRLFDRLTKRNSDPMRKHVNTKANLRWDVLCDLFAISGIAMPLGDDEILINRELCDARNEIAHGHGGAPDLDKFVKLRDSIFDRMSVIKNAIVNAATEEKYKLAS